MKRTLTAVAVLLVTALSYGCRNRAGNVTTGSDEPMIDPIPANQIPDAPVLSPQQAIADFVVEDGFSVDLIASEPDVIAPVALAFDGDGAIFVVEMRAYMENVEGSTEDKPIGTIRVLRDLDGDHQYETVSTFVDGLVMPRAIAIANNGLLVAEPPNLWFYENNNYVAGKRTLVDSTYAVGGNPEHQPNGLVRAVDNWYYSAKSDVRYRYHEGKWEKEPTEFRGQWGISQDDYGRLFYNHNSATLLGDNLTPGVMHYNPNHETTSRNYGASKASNKVYPIRINPGVNRAYRKETLDAFGKLDNMTAACGPVIFRGDSFPPEYYGNAFVMEPAGNLIKRVVLRDSSGIVSGSFPYEGREFLASTDERFRPVNAYTGPDGALYIVDMYRGVIQHSTYLTEYLRRQIEARGLVEPLDLGRIYRIQHDGSRLDRVPRLRDAGAAVLVKSLSDPNGWVRDTAQRLLIERNDRDVIDDLRKVAVRGDNPVAQVHALWTLEGLGAITVDDLRRASRSTREPKVVVHLLRLAAGLAESREAGSAFEFVAGTPSGGREIELQQLLSLQFFQQQYPGEAARAMAAIASRHADREEFVDALLGGLGAGSDGSATFAETAFLERMKRDGAGPDTRLVAALEQARFSEQTAPVLAALTPSQEHEALLARGRAAYYRECALCHGNGGRGLPATAPSLRRSSWVLQEPEKIVRIVLDGLTGPVQVNGELLQAPDVLDVMPGFRDNAKMTDEEIAALASFIRNEWDNRASIVGSNAVKSVRESTRNRAGQPYTQAEIESAADAAFEPLFAEGTLEPMELLGGTARFELRDGVLIGTTVAGSPNSFLATKKRYSDFVLEYEVRVDSQINSGVQIRSNSIPDYNEGRVHGYQIEVDPSDRAWSAGIYDEGRRGWLFDLRGNRRAREAFRQDEWNHYRVEAIGPHLRTWINGVLAADLIDDMTADGFIAFQVHSVGSPDLVGRTVEWRNIRIEERTQTAR